MRPLVPRSRYFTPAEANALLPLVRAVIKDAAERARLHNEVVDQLNDSVEEEDAELWARRKQEARRLRDEVETLIEQLGEEGSRSRASAPVWSTSRPCTVGSRSSSAGRRARPRSPTGTRCTPASPGARRWWTTGAGPG